jgi:predicted Fe-Mo cluster-binding NifX family protein
MATVVCVPVTLEGQIDPRWGRAARVAVAEVEDGRVVAWQEHDVGWDRTHDAQGEGRHHADVARFLLDHGVQAVVAEHMGPPMRNMLERMGLACHLGASGTARAAVEALVGPSAPASP